MPDALRQAFVHDGGIGALAEHQESRDSRAHDLEETNTRTRADRLPSDVLSLIFEACAFTAQSLIEDPGKFWSASQSRIEFTSGRNLPWIAIAQVCRYWRSVALACTKLWRPLLFSNPQATKEMIRLSKGAALTVKAHSWHPDESMAEKIQMVIPELYRVSVLHLCLPTSILQSLLVHFLAPAPKLESLRLRAEQFYDHPPDSFNLPDLIFANHSPSLRLLELTYCRFSWQSLPPSSLTHLELRRVTIPPSMTQFLSFLHVMPMLETLILDEALPTDSLHTRNSDVSSPRLFLPKLCELILVGGIDPCTHFLRHIAYPITTFTTFNCNISKEESPNLLSFFHAARSATGYEEGDHAIHVLGIRDNFGSLSLQCLVLYHQSVQLPQLHSQQMQLNFNLTWSDNHQMRFREIMGVACTALQLADVQILVLALYRCPDWSNFLSHLPKIHTIQFNKPLPFEHFDFLVDSEILLLPCLRSLWFDHVIFYPKLSQSLLACLQHHLQIGLAIKDIHLQDCWSFFKQDAERLKNLVQDVYWDGNEQEPPDYGLI